LLKEWLDQHPLDVADCEALVLAYVEQQLLGSDVLRSLLQQWTKIEPSSMGPLEIQAWMPEPPPASQLRALEWTADHKLTGQAGSIDPEILRAYARALMERYRGLRSVFYLPPQDELQTLLGELLNRDPTQRILHQLCLAELAWDRGDDASFLGSARQALENEAEWNSLTSAAHREALGFVLPWLIEAHQQKGELTWAWTLCQRARRLGYIEPSRGVGLPLAEMAYRKVQAAMKGQARPL
jgi:hypothetical protein